MNSETLSNIFTAITPWLLSHGVAILLIIVGTYVINIVIRRVIENAVKRVIKDQSQEAEEKRENTLIKIFHGTIHTILWIVAILMVLSEIGVNIGPLIAGAGVVGIAVGFGGQYLIKDLITGFFIILENQYRVGDGVEIAGTAGTVEDITLRVTVLRDIDGVVHHIPHGEVSMVSNKTKGISKVNLDIGVGYGADLNISKRVINDVGNDLAKDKYFKDLIIESPQFLRVNELGDSAITLKITGVTHPGKQFEVAGELRQRIKEAFDKEGIEIPFPQMVVHKA